MIWSCEKDAMGTGAYAGLIFNSFERAIAFVDWFLTVPTHYVNDIDMFINGLGGIDIERYNDFLAKQAEAAP